MDLLNCKNNRCTVLYIDAANNISELMMYEASVVTVSSSICLSCTFLAGSCADGCAVKLENDEHTFYFNTYRHNDEELIVLECFSVQEAGVYNVYVYEIQYGEVQEYISRQLNDIEIKIDCKGLIDNNYNMIT